MIKELTQEQIDKFPEYVKKHNARSMATGPVEFEKAVDAVRRAYQVANAEPPEHYLHFRSPVEAAKAAVILKQMRSDDNTRWLTASDFKATFKKRRKEEWDSIFYSTMKQMGWDYTSAELEAIRSKIKMEQSAVHNAIQEQVYGSQDSSWLSFYDFFLQEFDLECCKTLIPLLDLAEVCGWWAPYSHVAILQDRPVSIHFDDQTRLHNETGAAIEYSDGFGIYAIHDVRVPPFVILHPETITLEHIKNEDNAEIRRIMVERFGYERYFLETGAKIVDSDQVRVVEGEDVMMTRMLMRTENGDQFLVGTDGSTNRVYTMPVLEDVKTCKEAHQQISGLDESLCVAQS